MKILLDTHIFLWYILGDSKLPAAYRVAIQDPANEVYLSVASVWEAVIKYQIGKLPLPAPPAIYMMQQRVAHGIDAFRSMKPPSSRSRGFPHTTVIRSTASSSLTPFNIDSLSPR
jgi:PIN domain nuclease of toxin-antitoxin system